MSEKKIWSPFPRETYTITHQGRLYGLGVNPALAVNPGAWNICWLLAATPLEKLLSWSKDPLEFPTSINGLPYIVGQAIQVLPTTGEPFGLIAERSTPFQFLDILRNSGQELVLDRAFGPIWWALAEDNASKYSELANVVHVNFHRGGGRVQ